jgi:archaellum component FlaC
VGNSPNVPPVVHHDSGGGAKIAILFGIVIALVAANVYLFVQINNTRDEIAMMRESLLTEIGKVRETTSLTSQASRRHVETLRSELEAARRRAEAVAGAAREEALKQVEVLERKVTAESQKAQEQVKAELSKVEQNALAASNRVSENLTSAVGEVRKEVSSTKSELERTIADLKKVTGDLGVQSGLIATNAKELAALKALGERNYYEFNLVKSKQPYKLGDILITLKNADTKRNRYTIELVADDKKVEKKDKSLNEPVQFYMAKYRQPCEIVVNQVAKDRIVGYLSQPKVQTPRTTQAAANE